MHQNGRLECVIWALMPHVSSGYNVELPIDKRHKIGRGAGVTYPQPLQKQRYVMFGDVSARGHIAQIQSSSCEKVYSYKTLEPAADLTLRKSFQSRGAIFSGLRIYQ